MKHTYFLGLILLTLFLVCGSVQAQSTPTESKQDETNLETQLYIITGTNDEVADSNLPASLDSVIKQLRATLPFKNYRLASTTINRSKNEGRLELSWVGAPLVSVTESVPPASRSQFRVRQIRLTQNAEGQSIVQMTGFAFNASIPIPVAGAVAANNPGPPVFNYEGTALTTDLSMREGVPVIVGTLNAGPSGDAIILVVSVKRTAK